MSDVPDPAVFMTVTLKNLEKVLLDLIAVTNLLFQFIINNDRNINLFWYKNSYTRC